MDKLAKMELMDKMGRELEDLANSQTSVLKKIGQLEADNINLGMQMLDKKLGEIYERVDGNLTIVTELSEAFAEERNTFYTKNNIASLEDPTA